MKSVYTKIQGGEQHALANAWVKRYEEIGSYGSDPELKLQTFWVYEAFNDAVQNDPELAWALILAVLDLTNNDYVLDNLSAGPLEDLLSIHGVVFIDRVEVRAKTDPDFKLLLSGVWKGGRMSDEVWMRIEKAVSDD